VNIGKVGANKGVLDDGKEMASCIEAAWMKEGAVEAPPRGNGGLDHHKGGSIRGESVLLKYRLA
jgi:hypothetical protein